MIDAAVAAALQYVQEPHHIAGHIGVRVDGRVAHAGLGGQIDHALGTALQKEAADTFRVGDVHPGVRIARPRFQPGQPRFLQRHVVIVVEVVDADHLVSPVEQAPGHRRTDEPGGAGDQDSHFSTPAGCSGIGAG